MAVGDLGHGMWHEQDGQLLPAGKALKVTAQHLLRLLAGVWGAVRHHKGEV